MLWDFPENAVHEKKKNSVNAVVGYFRSNGNIHKKGRWFSLLYILSLLISFAENLIKIKIFHC